MAIKRFNNYKIIGDITEIYVIREDLSEYTILIDTKNLQKLLDLGYRIRVQWHEQALKYYAHITIYLGIFDGKPRNKNVTIQAFLFDKGNEECRDHINGNTLDNRESNIRFTSFVQNSRNRTRMNPNNKSGYRNVCLLNNWYRIQLQINGKNYMFSEKFKDVEEAAIFAEQMREKYYGEYAGMS